MTIAPQPPTPSPLHVFPFFRVEPFAELADDRGTRRVARPWALVALADGIASDEVGAGLEWGGFDVRTARSGAGLHRMVSNLVVGEARRMPALIVVAATLTDGPTIEVIRTFAALGWGIPILVLLTEPSEAPAFHEEGVHTLCTVTSGLVVGAAIRLWASGQGSPLHFH
jgi:hypothetical protein